MPEFRPKPFTPRHAPGAKISLRTTRVSGSYVQVSLPKTLQERAFGRGLAKGDHVIVALNTDKGRRHLMTILWNPDGEIAVTMGPHGSALIKLDPWRGCPQEPRKSATAATIAMKDGALVLRLPDWAQPGEAQ